LPMIAASAPSSSRTSFMAWRMSAAKKRLTCMNGIPRLVLAYGGNDGDLLVVRHFLIGQHMHAGNSQTSKAGEHGADRPGYQQHDRFAKGFLTLRGLHQIGRASCRERGEDAARSGAVK